MKELDKVTRVTLVDWTKDAELGRAFEKWDVKVSLDYQDDGRTLKIFVEDRE